VADKIGKSQSNSVFMTNLSFSKKTGETHRVTIATDNTAYDFQLRYESIKSLPSLFLLVLGLANFGFSFAFKSSYYSYSDLAFVEKHTNCTVPGSSVLAFYSIVLVLCSGAMLLAIIGCAFLVKITHLLSVHFCPIKIVALKKNWHKKPRDFAHFNDEFDFVIGDNEQPVCYPGVTQGCEGSQSPFAMAETKFHND